VQLPAGLNIHGFIKYNGKFLKLIEFKIDMDELGDNLKYVYNLYLNDTIIKNSEIFNNIKNLPPKYFESEIFLIGTGFKEKKSYIFDPFVIKKTNPEFFTNDFYLRFFISNQTGESAYEWKTKHEKKQLEQELKLKK